MPFEPERRVLLYKEEILLIVNELAQKIGSDFKRSGRQELVLVCVLQSARTLTLDLQKALQQMGIESTITYVKASSYGKNKVSNGKPAYNITKEKVISLKDKYAWVVDDMFDTGNTLRGLIELLANKEIFVNIVVLLKKIKEVSAANQVIREIIFFGIEIDDVWVDGYGIDSAKKNRKKRDIWAVITTDEQRVLWMLFRAKMDQMKQARTAEQSASTIQ